MLAGRSLRRLSCALPALRPSTPAKSPKPARKRPNCAPSPSSSGPASGTSQDQPPGPRGRLRPSRLEGDQLQDGGIYMARPEPLALAGEVEYELQQNGKPVGLFDIKNAGQEQGSWVGYGAWKPLPAPKPKPSMDEVARSMNDDEDSDRPVLHRKHPNRDSGRVRRRAPATGQLRPPTPTARPSTERTRAMQPHAPPARFSSGPDPDRPTLHKKDTSDSTGSGSASARAPSDDPDRPVLKKKQEEAAGGHRPRRLAARCHRSRPPPPQARPVHRQRP